jgi:prepilin-type N-terminal cleavage/methylation domain-containing protein/prepilin-type processing-associated H-X9-DG protein
MITYNDPPRARQARFAFTLVELLVVIGIIGVLVAILMPVLSKARRQANTVQCLSNERQLMMATIQYCNDWDGSMPFTGWGASGPNWLNNTPPSGLLYIVSELQGGQLWPYLTSYGMYRCAQDFPPWPSGNIQQMTSYVMNGAVTSFSSQPLHKITQFQGSNIIYWEIPSFTVGGVSNDGVNYPPEGITARHNGATTAGYVDGHADLLTVQQFTNLCLTGPSDLWCDPDAADGGISQWPYGPLPNPVPAQDQ